MDAALKHKLNRFGCSSAIKVIEDFEKQIEFYEAVLSAENTLSSSVDHFQNKATRAEKKLEFIEEIAKESDGIAGYHLNGETVTWEELENMWLNWEQENG